MRTNLDSALVVCSLLAAAVDAQVGVRGRITWQGEPVSGARVRLAATGEETLTDSAGRYVLGTPSRLDAATVRDPAARPGSGAWVEATGRSLRDPFGGHARGIRYPRAPADPPDAALAKTAAPPFALQVAARGYHDTTVASAADQAVLDLSLRRDTRRHLWIWGGAPALDAAERDSLFAFAARKGIGTLYQDAGGLVLDEKAALAVFLDAAKARGLAVELLFGAPEWALPANHGKPVALARETLALVGRMKAAGGAYPTSIQMDVEPYSLPAWDADRDAVAEGLVVMYEKMAEALAGSPVGLTACIPRWFDGIPLARGGVTRPLSHWLADATDRLTLMDYVDQAKGVIDGAAGELDYADLAGKEVVIGVETVPDLEPESVSFAEEGEAAMEAALSEVRAKHGSRKSFFGIAIHSYRHYAAMKP